MSQLTSNHRNTPTQKKTEFLDGYIYAESSEKIASMQMELMQVFSSSASQFIHPIQPLQARY
jgi:hypothetical protein